MSRFLLALLMLPPLSQAADCTVRSGPQMNALVELYTSEGCSSCPPADRWISSFTRRADPRIVPLAFHINYWDYIGWKDVYADARFTQRQRDYAKVFRSNSVYTPQVVLAGRDYRSWRDGSASQAAIDAVKAREPGAVIEVSTRAAAAGSIEGRVSAQLAAGAQPSHVALIVALTQNGISTRVTAGENRGEKLDHNFVVRDLAVLPAGGGKFTFAAKPDWNPARMAVVAFAQDLRDGRILQALSGPFCN